MADQPLWIAPHGCGASFRYQDIAAMLTPLHLARSLALVALLSTVGCSYPYVYCAPDDCGPCGPQIGNVGCTDCGDASCKTTCGKPARGVFTHLKYMATCGGGCGDFYIHPWINERPDDCDPCDNHGNWIGPNPCCGGFWGSFWGEGCCETTCSSCTSCAQPASCGCDSCGGGPIYAADVSAAGTTVITAGGGQPHHQVTGGPTTQSPSVSLGEPIGQGVSQR